MWTGSLLNLVAIWDKQDQTVPAKWNELYELLRNSLSKQREIGCKNRTALLIAAFLAFEQDGRCVTAEKTLVTRRVSQAETGEQRAKLAADFANCVGGNLSIFFLILDLLNLNGI